jgi:hypothetical protein
MLFGDVRGDGLHCLLCLRERDAGLQARESPQPVIVAVPAPLRVECLGTPKINCAPQERVIKTRRHHADDLHALSVQLQCATQDVRVSSEAAHPKSIAEDDDPVGACLMLFGSEDTPESRLNAECREEICRGGDAPQTLCRRSRLGEIWDYPGMGDHVLEDVVLLALLEEVTGRMRPTLRMR